MEELTIEKIREQVQNYFDKNGRNYIQGFEYLSGDEKQHIVDIGTSIISHKLGVGFEPGSFVKAFCDNDLRKAFTCADNVNIKAIRFYVMMEWNLEVEI